MKGKPSDAFRRFSQIMSGPLVAAAPASLWGVVCFETTPHTVGGQNPAPLGNHG